VHLFVMCQCMMLCKVVCQIFSAFLPVDPEVALADTIAYPVESHVDCFGLSLFNAVIDNTLHDFVVSLKGCCWLGMPHAL